MLWNTFHKYSFILLSLLSIFLSVLVFLFGVSPIHWILFIDHPIHFLFLFLFQIRNCLVINYLLNLFILFLFLCKNLNLFIFLRWLEFIWLDWRIMFLRGCVDRSNIRWLLLILLEITININLVNLNHLINVLILLEY